MAKKSSIAHAKYDDKNMIRYNIKLHKENDRDIIDAIDPQNKQGSIKKLIRNGFKNNDE